MGQRTTHTADCTVTHTLPADPGKQAQPDRSSEASTLSQVNLCAVGTRVGSKGPRKPECELGKSTSTQGIEWDPFIDSDIECQEGSFLDLSGAGSTDNFIDDAANQAYERALPSYWNSPSTSQSSEPRTPDSRSLQKSDLADLIESNVRLDRPQKDNLYALLVNYLEFMTARPGKCKLFSYKFHVNTTQPTVAYSRPVPFALRPAIREQIDQLIKDDILEVSDSPFINPLSVVHKEGKKIRICVDARKINQFTEPDRERVAPMHELLQRFNGARFMTSLDLTSAYLQVPLHEESRKYTAFLFDSACYQYKRVPYGFRNSLAGFVRALKLALGNGTDEYTVFYCEERKRIIHIPNSRSGEETQPDPLTMAFGSVNGNLCIRMNDINCYKLGLRCQLNWLNQFTIIKCST